MPKRVETTIPTEADLAPIAPVRAGVTVKASLERAFAVFTAEFDSWWPRSHHIGSSPMTRAVIEGRAGGRCYSEQEDGGTCDWGTVLTWNPPHGLSFAWQITPQWQFQPDLAQASEVEVTFTPLADGSTHVELEHRHFERHGAGAAAMRAGVGAPNGWTSLMVLYRAQVDDGH